MPSWPPVTRTSFPIKGSARTARGPCSCGRPMSRTTSRTSPTSYRRRLPPSWPTRVNTRPPWASVPAPHAQVIMSPSPTRCGSNCASTGSWPGSPGARVSTSSRKHRSGNSKVGGPKAPDLTRSRRNVLLSAAWQRRLLAPLRRLAGRSATCLLGRRALGCPLGRRALDSLLGCALGGLLGRCPPHSLLGCALGGLLGRSTLHCLLGCALGGLLGRSTLHSPFGCAALGGLLGRRPLHSPFGCAALGGFLRRSTLDGLLGCCALRCLLCWSPFYGLFGRGPSFRGYCHRCTSLGAWSLNRGEACATPI